MIIVVVDKSRMTANVVAAYRPQIQVPTTTAPTPTTSRDVVISTPKTLNHTVRVAPVAAATTAVVVTGATAAAAGPLGTGKREGRAPAGTKFDIMLRSDESAVGEIRARADPGGSGATFSPFLLLEFGSTDTVEPATDSTDKPHIPHTSDDTPQTYT